MKMSDPYCKNVIWQH